MEVPASATLKLGPLSPACCQTEVDQQSHLGAHQDATCRGVSPKSGSRPLGGERKMQPEPLPGRIFNPTIAAEGRQNVDEKGHSFSERREAEIEPPENAYLRVGKIGVAEFGQSAVSPCTFKGLNNQPISSIPGSRTGG